MGNTILLVEDEAIIALSTKMGLEKYGYSVITANTGEKAIEIAGKSPSVDLILMDIDLGKGIDGTETARQILEKREIPLLFLSSHTEREVVEKTEKITSYGYVVKNSSLTVLDASIKMAFKLYNANHTLKTTLDKFEATLNTIPDLLFEVTHDGYYCDIRTKSPELLFRPREEMIGKTISETLPPQQAKIIISAINEASITGISHGKQYKLDIPGIGERFFELSVAPAIKNNPDSHFIYLSRDITDRKNAEKELRKKEERYLKLNQLFRTMANTMTDLLWAKDLDKKFIFSNKANAATLFDTDNPEKLIGKGDMYFVNRMRKKHPDNPRWHTFAELCMDSDAITLEAGKPMHFYEYGNVKGKFLYLDVWKAPLHDSKGKLIGVVGSARDITDLKAIQDKLVLSEKTYKDILNIITENVFIIDYEGTILDINNSVREGYGYTKEYLVGQKIDILFPPGKNNINEFFQKIQKAYKGKTQSLEFWSIQKNDNLTLRQVNLTQGEFFGKKAVIAVSRDITKQRKVEHELQKYEMIVNQSPLCIIVTNKEGDIEYVNPQFTNLTGHTLEDALGKNPRILKSGQTHAETYINMWKTILSGNIWEGVLYNKKKNGELYIERASIAPIISRDNKIINIVAIKEDITKIEKSEAEIKKLLAEKEILLKEVHHRVKNNMSTLDSMLKLQREEVHDPIAMAALEDTSMRIRTMIELYDKLYGSADYTNLSAEEYFSSLIDEIVSSFPKGNSIHVNKEFDKLFFDVKILHPLGIIVNEIITNVMKYAYKDATDPVLNISLKKHTNTVSLVVQDNGAGLPQNFDIEKQTGFGLRLIILLTAQLQGEFIMENNNGTRNKLTFPVQ